MELKSYQQQAIDDLESKNKIATLHFLRQQSKKAKDHPNFCLADFIAGLSRLPRPHRKGNPL